MAILKVVNSGGIKKRVGLKNVLDYVLRSDKTDADTLCFVTESFDAQMITPQFVFEAFDSVKKQWSNTSGRLYAHTVLSFHKDDQITPQECLDFGIEFAGKAFPGHQTLVVVHTDKEHLHVHFVTNTVGVDGKKLHKSKRDLEHDKLYCNHMCKEMGLSIAEKGKHCSGKPFEEGDITAWSKDKYHLLINGRKPSYLVDCGLAVINALDKSRSKQVFLRLMEEQGWQTVWEDSKKHITFVSSEGQKVRDTNILKSFGIDVTKEGLRHEFERKATGCREAKIRIESINDSNARLAERNQTASL